MGGFQIARLKGGFEVREWKGPQRHRQVTDGLAFRDEDDGWGIPGDPLRLHALIQADGGWWKGRKGAGRPREKRAVCAGSAVHGLLGGANSPIALRAPLT